MIIDGDVIDCSDDSDDVEISPRGDLYLGGKEIHIGDDGTTSEIILNPLGQTFVAFKGDPESWEGSAPLWLHDAVNRLAYALSQSGKKP